MKLSEWASIAEITSALAVVITLLILIFELRDNTQAIERTYEQESSRLGATARSMMFEVDGLAELFVKARNEEPLSEVEQAKLVGYTSYLLRMFEIQYNLYTSGGLPQDRAEILHARIISSMESVPGIENEIARCLECYSKEYLDWLGYNLSQ